MTPAFLVTSALLTKFRHHARRAVCFALGCMHIRELDDLGPCLRCGGPPR